MIIPPIAQSPATLASVQSLEQLKEKKAFVEMEQLFIQMLLKEMRKTVPEGGVFDTGLRGQFFESMLDEAFSMKMAESGQLQIAAAMEAQYGVESAENGALPGSKNRLPVPVSGVFK